MTKYNTKLQGVRKVVKAVYMFDYRYMSDNGFIDLLARFGKLFVYNISFFIHKYKC